VSRATVIALRQFWRWRSMRRNLWRLHNLLVHERLHKPYEQWKPTAMLVAEIQRDFDEITRLLKDQYPRLALVAGYVLYPELV
jgi:hypothetical protein